MKNKELREKVYRKYNGHCAYCGCELDIKKMQIDHFNPASYGGSNELDNYMPACKDCNNYKYNYDIELFRSYIQNVFDKLPLKFRVAEKIGIFERKNITVKFYYETVKQF